MSIILFFVVLFLVVVVHEAGHFFAAKSMGMRVKEFAFGFPPRLFSFIKGETKYSINALPLGGYVSIDGENGESEIPDPKLFTSKSKLAQAWVLFAGPLMNIVLAFILLSVSFMVGYGDTKNPNSLVILSVAKDSPAEIAGIKAGDVISNFDQSNNSDEGIDSKTNAFQSFIADSNGNPVVIAIERGNDIKNLEVTPRQSDDSSYKIGVSLGILQSKKLGFFASIREGFITTATMTRDITAGFGKLLSSLVTGNSVKDALTGPIGIAKEVGTVSKFGFSYLLSFVALISINLGILNLFPFPALDGGRLLFLLIEKIKGSRIKTSVANAINTIGFGLLILLMVFVTIKDVIRLF